LRQNDTLLWEKFFFEGELIYARFGETVGNSETFTGRDGVFVSKTEPLAGAYFRIVVVGRDYPNDVHLFIWNGADGYRIALQAEREEIFD